MNWKTPITLVALLLLLLGAVYYGWQAATAPASSDTTSTSTSTPTTDQPSCTNKRTTKKTALDSNEVVVNVYNAGNVAGLASDTMTRLTAQGFQEGHTKDAPARVKVSNVAILSKTTRTPEVELAAAQFQGSVAVRKDNLAPGVDIVVGDQFQGVDPRAETSIVVRRPVRRCTDAGTPTP